MKKFLFMCLAMFCMVFAAVSLNSCTEEDSPKNSKVYQVKAKVEIYDPQNELTNEQKSILQNYISSVGEFDSGIDVNEERVHKSYNTWATNLGNNINKFVGNNPDVTNTEAGIKIVSDTNGAIIKFNGTVIK